MNYQETINFLFTRLPMFSRIGAAAYKADITNTILLCEAVGNPQEKFKSVHIAGTNGKGSTSHMLAAILQSAGYKTGLYTSPHLKDFRERIKINGEEISEEFVVDFTERISPFIDKIEPSFFEITVAMAFEYFEKNKVDIAIIETGLGGRLDSTNIIKPEVSVITNIGMDHMNLLGNTLQAIAGEKAGIIKKGIPAIIGAVLPETEKVFTDKALQVETSITIASQQKWISDWHHHKQHLVATVAHHQEDEQQQTYELDLPGIYQLKNLITVLETIKILRQKGWIIEEKYIKSGLKNVKKLTGLFGRWQILQQHPTIVLDVAHNEDGIRQIVQQLETEVYTKLHIIIGMVKDKEIETVLSLLPQSATYYFTKAQIPRALDEVVLMNLALKYNLSGASFPNVNDALTAAKTTAGNDDLILVCGSVFIVGEVNY